MPNSSVGDIISYALWQAKTTDVTGVPGIESTALIHIVDRENRQFCNAPYEANQAGWDFMADEMGFTVQTADKTSLKVP